MKRVSQLLILISLALPSLAQVAVTPIVQPHVTFVDASGGPCASCTLGTFAAGTTTPLASYTDSSGTSQNTNPIILDAAGGAQIWLGNNSYKLVLKDASGTTIWTVDQVKGGGGSGGICGPAGAIQIANSAVNGLTCDATITINTTTHTINVGTLPTNHITIGALGVPTSWTFDTTSPATALASLGAGAIGSGTTNQLAFYPATGNNVQGVSTIPDGVTAITRAVNDNSAYPATTAFVAKPGGISPTGIALNSGSPLNDNQGNGAKVQHSTGATTPNNCVKFDAAGNTVDAGAPCAIVITPRTCNSNGCYRIDGDGTINAWGTISVPPTGTGTNTATITFPTSFTSTTNLALTITTVGVAGSGDAADPPGAQLSSISTTGAGVFMARFIQASEGGGHFDNTITLNWHAIGN